MNTINTSQKLANLTATRDDSAKSRLVSFVLLCFLGLFLGTAAYAQKAVTGKVTDAADNSGLPGVSVSVKGTTTGSVTDATGSFSLNVPNDNTTLVFSFVGYVTQEVAVGSRSSVDVALAADVQSLQEVVVIGYGTQQKKDVTGGVVALTPKEFNQGVIASPEQLLQGRAAGVQITPASGEPGGAVNVRIRGATSIRGNNNPLYVIDGVPVDGGNVSDGGDNFGAGAAAPRNPLNFLNPADIENVTVLKDASASAIYGSRGANGVVLITTRRGKSGQQTLNFGASTSVGSTLRRYDLLSASEFPDAVQRADGDPTDPAVNAGGSTDWQDEIFRTAVSQNYNLDFGGGNDNTRYFFSVSYSDQQGIIKNSGLTRLTGRVNASHELFNDKVVLDLNLTTSGIRDKFVPGGDNAGFQGNVLGAALQANPTYPVRDAQGRWFTPNLYEEDNTSVYPQGTYRNPTSMIEGIDANGNTNRTLASISGTWKIVKGLSYKINFGLDYSTAVRRTSIDRGLPGFQNENVNNISLKDGFATIQNRFRNMFLIEHTMSYNGKVGIGTVDAVAGFSYQKFENRGNFIQAGYFFPDFIGADIPLYENLGGVNNKDNKAFFGGSSASQNEIQSVFGRINYNIKDKYLLTATVRADGSSRFGENNKYGVFPSFAAAWRLSGESFMPQGLFDDLKLRANWGQTGNQDFPGNISRPIFNPDPNNGAISQVNGANPNIRWEATTQFGVGIDFALMNGRLTGAVDYFNRNTTDFIFNQILAQPAPVTRGWINLPGNFKNTGFEFTLGYEVLQEKALKWQVNYNMTLLKTAIDGLGTSIITGNIDGQGLSGAYSQLLQDGNPVNAFFLREFGGYDDQGFGIYPNGEELTYAGQPNPSFTFGLTNNFTYNRWNLNIFLNGATGFSVYNNTANAYFLKGNLQTGRNVSKEVASSQENSSNFGEVSTRFLEKGDFARLSNLTLGYNFSLPEGGFAKSVRLSLTGQNLLLFTNYSGIDPEVNTNKARDEVPSQGIDYLAYPSARIFTLGLNVGF